MKKCEYSEQREKIVADAIRPVATELRLIDAADYIALLRFESHGSLADLVSSAAELYFLPGTVNFGIGGNYTLDWDTEPEISLDLELEIVLCDTVVSRTVDTHVAELRRKLEDDPANPRYILTVLKGGYRWAG